MIRWPNSSRLVSWTASLLVHAVLLALAACWIFADAPAVTTGLQARQASLSDLDLETLDSILNNPEADSDLNTPEMALTAESSRPLAELVPESAPEIRPVAVPKSQQAVPLHPAFNVSTLALNGKVARLSGGGGNGSAEHPAAFSGSAAGGDGFFGLNIHDSRRIVFVVDNSKSMNHPHDSDAKTRYRRLKLELVRCLLQMQAQQAFYVIFFSDETTPMPARDLQPCIPEIRDRYLHWIASLPTGAGPTDPREAMQHALRLQPDIICFLTDGDFYPGFQKHLLQIQQRRTAIHTFAIGNADAAATLSALAEQNRGEYRFIP